MCGARTCFRSQSRHQHCPDDPIDVAAPTESADELIRAAAAELENKPMARPPDTGEPL